MFALAPNDSRRRRFSDVFQKLRSANQKITRKAAGIESFYDQFKQLRIRNEEFEKQTAQAIAFHESEKLVQSGIGVGSFGDPIQQNRAQSLEYLASSCGDMKTRRTSFKPCERFFCSFCILEKSNRDFGALRRASRNNPLKYGAHRSHSALQRRCEIAGRREPKAAREPAQWIGLVRNSVGLLFGFDLEAVFNAAKESIRIVQRQNFIGREQIQFS